MTPTHPPPTGQISAPPLSDSVLRYKPCPHSGELRTGEPRYVDGVTTTDRRYTGQRAEGIGLYDYRARWYDPALGRFAQADTIVPGAGNPMAWDRYAYALNNSLRYSDPSGHIPAEEICKYLNACNADEFIKMYGQDLYTLLWDTDISWGSTLVWYENGKEQRAYLTLLNFEGVHIGGLVGLQGRMKDKVFSLSQLNNVGTVGALTLNDVDAAIQLPPDLQVSNDFCEPTFCADIGDTRYTVYPEIQTEIHPGWWIMAATSVTAVEFVVVNVINNAIGYKDVISGVGTTLGYSHEDAKRWQYYYDKIIGTPATRFPSMHVVFREFKPTSPEQFPR